MKMRTTAKAVYMELHRSFIKRGEFEAASEVFQCLRRNGRFLV